MNPKGLGPRIRGLAPLKSRIAAMTSRERNVVGASTIAMWVALLFTYFAANSPAASIALFVALMVHGIVTTVSIAASSWKGT